MKELDFSSDKSSRLNSGLEMRAWQEDPANNPTPESQDEVLHLRESSFVLKFIGFMREKS
jgi:hypothetical protein